MATSFKSVLLEGLEVAFIVITFGLQANNSQGAGGAQRNGILIAALGAFCALLLVVGCRRVSTCAIAACAGERCSSSPSA